MAEIEPRSTLPTTGLGRLGAFVSLGGLVVFLAMIATDALQSGPDERPGFWIAWLIITAGGVLLLVALGRGERGWLAFAALAPFALFLLLLLMELTGLME